MQKMKYILLPILAIFSTIAANGAFPGDETLRYDVMFKWGLINKKAGEVTIETENKADGTFTSMLIGKSAKWADRFYSVRDTLTGSIVTDGLVPLSYQKISHEGGEFKRDIITYERTGNLVNATCDRYHQKKKDKPVIHSQKLLTAEGYTIDMLSAFYYMRCLDFKSMVAGESKTMNIFSGKRKEILTITYRGREMVDNAGTDSECYKISFSFTSDGVKKTSDDLYAWISTCEKRIPIKLQGKLPVGTIKCFYVP